jgi:multicomponent Na+:H+ antiporter subunit G
MSSVLGTLIIIIGLFSVLCGCIALVRWPDVYCRLQHAIKTVTLGTCLIMAGVIVYPCNECTAVDLKVLLTIIFIVISSPAAAHSLARSSYVYGIKLWGKNTVDELKNHKNVETENKDE